jgi:hypothetical protein
MGRTARSDSTKLGYARAPDGVVARSIIPCVTPLIHIATT